MAYVDEMFIKDLNQYKKESYGGLEQGFYIKEEHYTFKRVSFFQDRMSVMLSEQFIDLPEAIVKLKYPSEQRPKIIKSSKDGSINFAFTLADEVPLAKENVTYITDTMRNGLKNINPSITMGEAGTMDVANTTLSWFEFQNNAFDGTIYNIMYCIPIDGKMMHGLFNCLVQDKEAWRKVVFEVMKSIEDLTRTE